MPLLCSVPVAAVQIVNPYLCYHVHERLHEYLERGQPLRCLLYMHEQEGHAGCRSIRHFYPLKTQNPETQTDGESVQVHVRDNNVDQALKALKKKMQREGIFREMKLRNYYEKPSEKRAREKAEAIRRARKLARKRLQREGVAPGRRA